MEDWGPLKIIPGENNSRFPYCTSLLLEGNGRQALIDPGAGNILKNLSVQEIYLTHYHYDHVWGINFFPKTTAVFINAEDLPALADLREFARRLGTGHYFGKDYPNWWAQEIKKGFKSPSLSPYNRPDIVTVIEKTKEAYPTSEEIKIVGIKTIFLKAPGHTPGYVFPYFPDLGIIYTGDYDLTSFGPFYMAPDGDIDQFISSSKILREVDVKYYITGHEKGMVEKKSFLPGLDRFLEIIALREEKIKTLWQKGYTIEEIADNSIFYPLKFQKIDPWVRMWEIIGIKMHLKRLGLLPKAS
ncbi:MBL fold metallo-hydrolase [Carboxydothermus ferrireducens]|uniref:Glyoxylase-like metal-dependent hydrolase (Beta-lactamase superfamily II) n=1 Tax=Carboxydothermus ferrireducens DSM 11255 TaxID=1119529 RepID=A0ABX2R6K1_9THEO|nr:MBL fold metallo-hydrolase [Carboxydothermus ferrireducens]NYE56540.1 glyoxylase-like metal-dependent hydrolase (beta-lactamase superfamily II) [Carboxydothermus ferrireducens DSM 11255]